MNGKIVAAIIVVLAVGAVGWYLQRKPPVPELVQPGPDAVAPAAPSQPVVRDQTPSAAEPVRVPPPATLEGSDAQVAELLGELSPRLSDWLTPADQLRKWMAVVDQAAEGNLPLKNRPINYPMASFKVRKQDGTLLADPANAARAKPLIDAITAIPPERMAAYYRAWRPLLDQAYAELGSARPGGFDQRLRLAIEQVLAAKPLPETAALTRPKINYTYVDAKLERAGELDKLLWRLGPDNTRKLQDYLRALQPQL
jgi:hypothetical protein